MANRKKDPMDPSFQAEAVIGAGRGALIVAMFEAGWLGWGLGRARAFTGFVGPAFGFIELFLLACSVYVIRKGRLLRKQYPPRRASTRQPIRKPFLLVVLIEVLALVARFGPRESAPSPGPRNRLVRDGRRSPFSAARKDLSSASPRRRRHPNDPMVRLCWSLFGWNALVISVTVGTGILLWAASVSALFRARKIVHSLQ